MDSPLLDNLDLDKLIYGQAFLSLLNGSFMPTTNYNIAIFLFGLSALESSSSSQRLRQFMAVLVMSILIDVFAIANAPAETSTLGTFLVVVNMFLKFLTSWATLGSLKSRQNEGIGGGGIGGGNGFGGGHRSYAPLANDWRGSSDAPSLSGDFAAPPVPNKPTTRYTDVEAAMTTQRPTTGLNGPAGQRPTTTTTTTAATTTAPSKPMSSLGGNEIRVEGYHTIE